MAEIANDNLAESDRIDQLALRAGQRLRAEVKKRNKLLANLHGDLERHGEPELWRRYGDLILANLNSARRHGDRLVVIDYFEDAAPEIEIEGEHHRSLNEIAEDYFRRYTKARNALKVITERMETTSAAIREAEQQLARIEAARLSGDEPYLNSLLAPKRSAHAATKPKKKIEKAFRGARRFVSSDGFEILVGKKASDNDFLTFRVAKSLDLWLHAADYPGSHVVIRGHGKKDVPDRTLKEAAEVAAFYSDAREQPKAAVKYTQKKFVNKPKRSAPGLVSLSAFRTILVEPKIAIEMIREEQG